MPIIAKWNGYTFQVSDTDAAMIGNFKLSGKCKTKEKTENGQVYVEAESREPAEISVTAILNASFGVDVRSWTERLVEEAQKGGSDYFYMGGKKVAPFKFLLAAAETEEIMISATGKWTRTNVNLTLKQSSQNENIPLPKPPVSAGDSGGHSEPKKASVKSGSPTRPTVSPGKKPPKSDYSFMVDAQGKVIIPGKPPPPVGKVNQTVAQAKSVKSNVSKQGSGARKPIASKTMR